MGKRIFVFIVVVGLVILNGCSLMTQRKCMGMLDRGEAVACRECCEQIGDEVKRETCFQQVGLVDEICEMKLNASEKEKNGMLLEAFLLCQDLNNKAVSMEWVSADVERIQADAGITMDRLMKSMVAQIEQLVQTRNYRQAKARLEKYQSILESQVPRKLLRFKRQISSGMSSVEDLLSTINSKIKNGEYESAGILLQKVKQESPDYLAEIRKFESIIQYHNEKMLRTSYEKLKQDYQVFMRKKSYKNAALASDKALTIARQNPRLGLDISNIGSMHKKALTYCEYAKLLEDYNHVMHSEKGKDMRATYKKAVVRAQKALDFVASHRIISGEMGAARSQLNLARENLRKADKAEKERQRIARLPYKKLNPDVFNIDVSAIGRGDLSRDKKRLWKGEISRKSSHFDIVATVPDRYILDYYDNMESFHAGMMRPDISLYNVEDKLAFVRRGVGKGGDCFFEIDSSAEGQSSAYEVEISLYKEFESIF